MLIVNQAEYNRIRSGEQTALLYSGEVPIQAEWGPQPIRVGYRGEADWIRVVAVRHTRMGQLTASDVRHLCAPSVAACRASWNQRHPVYDRWHASRLVTLVRMVYSGAPAIQEQSTLFDLEEVISP